MCENWNCYTVNKHFLLQSGSRLEVDWRKIGGRMEAKWKQTGIRMKSEWSRMEADWKQTGSRIEANWKQTRSRLEAAWKQTGSWNEAEWKQTWCRMEYWKQSSNSSSLNCSTAGSSDLGRATWTCLRLICRCYSSCIQETSTN